MDGPGRDLDRIAFVTRRFGDLQGLRTASVGAILVAAVVAYEFVPTGARDPFMQIVFIAQLLSSAAIGPLNAFYLQHFGSAPARACTHATSPRSASPYPILATLVMLGLLVEVPLAIFARIRLPFGPAVMTGYALWIVVRDWPYRAHYAVAVTAGAAGLVTVLSVPLDVFARAVAPTCAVLGLALIVVGLLDHRLLATSISGAADRSDGAGVAVPVAKVRIVLAGGILAAVTAHLAFLGWPTDVQIVRLLMWGSMILIVMIAGFAELRMTVRSSLRALAMPRRSRRRGQGEAEDSELALPEDARALPPPDLWGHLVLPIVIACGALVDIPLRGTGLPSFLALALAASHARIALRDWPARRHYLLGAAAASVSAIQHMFIGAIAPLDWATWFLLLFGTAALVEGVFDYRFAKSPRHAHAL